MTYRHLAEMVSAQPWAMLPDMLAVIGDLIRYQAERGTLTPEDIQEATGYAAVRANPSRAGNVAILPVYGVVSQRMNLMAQLFGGTSTEQYGAAFQQAVNDPNVRAIIMPVDSPGGSVAGVAELASQIYQSRGQKPVVAVADSMAASAAYWIASAADEIVVTPGGMVGSIGVYQAHQDLSAANDQAGIKTTLISAGKYKTEASPFAPLTADARDALQQTVNDYYNLFVSAVARGRGVPVADVRNGMGEGRMVTAPRAVQLNMADRVATLADTLRRFGVGPSAVPVRGESAGDTVATAVATAVATGPDGLAEIEVRRRRLRVLGDRERSDVAGGA